MKPITFLSCLFLCGLLFLPAKGVNPSKETLECMSELDSLLGRTHYYANQRVSIIESLKKEAAAAPNDESRFWIARRIFDEYKTFDSDSAIAYGVSTIQLANNLNRPDLKNDVNITVAYVLAAVGRIADGSRLLASIDFKSLNNRQQVDYLSQRIYLVTHQVQIDESMDVEEQMTQLVDSIASIIDKSHPEYIYHKAYHAMYHLELIQQTIKEIEPTVLGMRLNSQYSAKMAWLMAQLYERMGDRDMKMYYLARSAIADVKIANREIASLEELAVMLEEDRDLNRAQRYIDHAMVCAELYKNRARALHVASLHYRISKEYQQEFEKLQNSTTRFLFITVGLIVVLLGTLIYIIVQRRKLNVSYLRVKAANQEKESHLAELSVITENLTNANEELKRVTEELQQANERLSTNDQVKMENLGRTFTYTSNYIDQLESFRVNILRLLKTGQYDKALSLSTNTDMQTALIKDFYRTFDSVFLSVFPDFVENFNSLLKPESRIEPRTPDSLTTGLRIYALVRMGITDSVTIASVLHISVQTVYNKRLKVRNSALTSRDNFVEAVRAL